LLGVSAALAAGAATSVSAFLVGSAVEHGFSESAAGLTLTFGSALCVTCRVVAGWLADRWQRGHLTLVAAMLITGAVGVAMFGLGSPVALVVGVSLGFGLGWCWPGLLAFSVVRLRPLTPAAATSVTQTGVYAGACVGPIGFGLVVSHAGYPAGWGVAAAAMAAAAGFVLIGASIAARTASGVVS
jgi:cyanate permease